MGSKRILSYKNETSYPMHFNFILRSMEMKEFHMPENSYRNAELTTQGHC